MTRSKAGLAYGSLAWFLAGAMLLMQFLANGASAQSLQGSGTIDAGTTITVRTNEAIDAKDSDGRIFSGVVEQDVMNRNGSLAIPKGSDVEMVVKRTSNNEVALDLNALTVNGQRYGIESEDRVITSERKEGIGANKRTGKYVGGGALLGAVIGAIAGGGKGAAIGAGAGAAAGAGVQILTRGGSVHVPAESLLTFRLQQPLRTGVKDSRTSAAYRDGLQAGRSDSDRNLPRNTHSSRWSSGQQRRDYEAGYNRGYDAGIAKDIPSYGRGNIYIGDDNNVTWDAPEIARVFVQVDNNPVQLFAEGQSGTQAAPWIKPPHVYVFMLRDMNGNEIARDRLDLRRSPR